MDLEEFVAAVCPRIGEVGNAFYFAPATMEVARQQGISPLHLYYLGRGGPLGEADPALVASAFGFFAPALVADMWTEACRTISPGRAAHLYFSCSAGVGRSCLGALDLEPFCQAAGSVVAAADPAGLPLFAAYVTLPLVSDWSGRAMQLATVLRELRGSAHLVALVATGIDPKLAHMLKRPSLFRTFGWADEDRPELDGQEWERLAEAERLTDRILLPAYRALDATARRDLLEGITAMAESLVAAGLRLGDDQGARERSHGQ